MLQISPSPSRGAWIDAPALERRRGMQRLQVGGLGVLLMGTQCMGLCSWGQLGCAACMGACGLGRRRGVAVWVGAASGLACAVGITLRHPLQGVSRCERRPHLGGGEAVLRWGRRRWGGL